MTIRFINSGGSDIKKDLIRLSGKKLPDVHIEGLEGKRVGGNMVNISENSDGQQDADTDASDKWYKRPVGIVVLTVVSGTIVAAIGIFGRHLLGL